MEKTIERAINVLEEKQNENEDLRKVIIKKDEIISNHENDMESQSSENENLKQIIGKKDRIIANCENEIERQKQIIGKQGIGDANEYDCFSGCCVAFKAIKDSIGFMTMLLSML